MSQRQPVRIACARQSEVLLLGTSHPTPPCVYTSRLLFRSLSFRLRCCAARCFCFPRCCGSCVRCAPNRMRSSAVFVNYSPHLHAQLFYIRGEAFSACTPGSVTTAQFGDTAAAIMSTPDAVAPLAAEPVPDEEGVVGDASSNNQGAAATTSGTNQTDGEPAKRKAGKRKCVVLFGYLGTGYHGLQL